jgi:hypothetical protein
MHELREIEAVAIMSLLELFQVPFVAIRGNGLKADATD